MLYAKVRVSDAKIKNVCSTVDEVQSRFVANYCIQANANRTQPRGSFFLKDLVFAFYAYTDHARGSALSWPWLCVTSTSSNPRCINSIRNNPHKSLAEAASPSPLLRAKGREAFTAARRAGRWLLLRSGKPGSVSFY